MKQAVCLLAFTTALAGQPRCAIRGTVVDALTSQPLARTQVFVELGSDSDNDSSPPVRQITDTNGAFCFETLNPGSYSIRASRAFYVDASYGEHWPGSPGVSVDISSGKPSLPFAIRMMPEACISGAVTDADGDPVQDAWIELLRRKWTAGRLTAAAVGETKTDDRGRYRFARLAGGTYFISATPGRASRAEIGHPQFLDGNRRPFLQVEGKTYYKDSISFRDAAPIRLSAGQQINPLLLTVRAIETRHVSGQAPPVALNMSPRVLWCVEKDSGRHGVGFNIPIQDNRHFLAEGLPPARYEISGPGAALTEIDLVEGSIDDLVLAPNESVTVQITVHLEGSKSNSIRSAELVQLNDSGKARSSTPAEFVSQNRFRAAVLPGGYEVKLGGDGPVYFTRKLAVDGEPQPRSIFDLKGGAPRSVELFLTPNVATIQGDIIDNRTTRSKVTLLIEDELYPERPQVKLTGEDEKFQLNLLHSGRYRLYAFEDFDSEAWGNPELTSLLAGKSAIVEVQEGQHRRVSLPLISVDAFQSALTNIDY